MAWSRGVSSYSLLPQEEKDDAQPGPSTMAASSTQAMPHDEFELSERKGARVSIEEISDKKMSFAEVIAEPDDDAPDATYSTGGDTFQMERMGKKQVLVRRFRPMSTFAFNAMATSVWEFGIFSISQGLVDGGRAGLIWTTIIHAVGFLPIGIYDNTMDAISWSRTNRIQFFPWRRWPVWHQPRKSSFNGHRIIELTSATEAPNTIGCRNSPLLRSRNGLAT